MAGVAGSVGTPVRVMGVLNVTPDSFSDGGLFTDIDDAAAHAGAMIDEGAEVIDVGGESTRPGADAVDAETEAQRVIPVIERIRGEWPDIQISVDTSKPAVAAAAVAAGATIVNDVSASLEAVAAETGAGWIAMHALGPSKHMQDDPRYGDVVAEVAAFLDAAAARARSLGVKRVWVDPGFGFGKTLEHNLALMASLDRFVDIAPTVVGVSRKSSIGALHGASDAAAAAGSAGTAAAAAGSAHTAPSDSAAVTPAATDDRLEGSLALAVWAAHEGADIVRAHDVAATVRALSVTTAGRGLSPVTPTAAARSAA